MFSGVKAASIMKSLRTSYAILILAVGEETFEPVPPNFSSSEGRLGKDVSEPSIAMRNLLLYLPRVSIYSVP